MTEIAIRAHRRSDPPLDFVAPSGLVVHVVDRLTTAVVEGGMMSGEPSVMILGVDPNGVGVVVETSLDKFLAAAVAMRGLAESRFGWVQPAGYVSLMPNPTVSDGRFHPTADGRPGDECLAKTCEREHLVVFWMPDPGGSS